MGVGSRQNSLENVFIDFPSDLGLERKLIIIDVVFNAILRSCEKPNPSKLHSLGIANFRPPVQAYFEKIQEILRQARDSLKSMRFINALRSQLTIDLFIDKTLLNLEYLELSNETAIDLRLVSLKNLKRMKLSSSFRTVELRLPQLWLLSMRGCKSFEKLVLDLPHLTVLKANYDSISTLVPESTLSLKIPAVQRLELSPLANFYNRVPSGNFIESKFMTYIFSAMPRLEKIDISTSSIMLDFSLNSLQTLSVTCSGIKELAVKVCMV